MYIVQHAGSLPLRDWSTDHRPAGDQPVPGKHGTAQHPNLPPPESGDSCGERERGCPPAGHRPLGHHPGARAEGTGSGGAEGPT